MPISLRDKKFLNYYQQEIDFLKQDGAQFAKEFPKIAGRLNFDHFETTDPHVARLLESFAFLTAQIQYKIDNMAFDVTNVLIDVLYPHLNKPLPSLSIAQLNIDDGGNKPPQTGFQIPRDTELFTYTTDGNVCRFSTVYPLNLLPIKITVIKIVSRDHYHFVSPPQTAEFEYGAFQKLTTYFCEISLECLDGNFDQLNFQDLLFYIDIEEESFKRQFYRSALSPKSLVYCARDMTAFPLLPYSLQKMGFERDEMAIMPTKQENHGYQLLQEYFHFPDKFMFFKLTQLNFLRYLHKKTFLKTQHLKFLIPLCDANNEWAHKITPQSLRLNCTPIINVFRTTTDPLSIDEKKVFYKLTPNAHKDRTMEIYNIEQVFTTDIDGTVQEIPPYFSLSEAVTGASSGHADTAKNLFWWSHTVPTHHQNLTGIDTEISFVDTDFSSLDFSHRIVYAKALCTNRFMAEDILAGTSLQIEKATPTESIVCLKSPITPQYSLKKGSNNAKLIAQLSINYLGFPYTLDERDTDIVQTLKNILMMHASELAKGQVSAMLQELDSVLLFPVTRRLGQEAWRGFVDGIHIELLLHSTNYINEWFLMALILQRYFSMNCQINTFVELTVKRDHVVLFQIDPCFGLQKEI